MAKIWFLIGAMGSGKTAHMFYLRQEIGQENINSISWRLPVQAPEKSRAYGDLPIGQHKVCDAVTSIKDFRPCIINLCHNTPPGSFVVLPDLLLFEGAWLDAHESQADIFEAWTWFFEYLLQQTHIRMLRTVVPINPIFSIGQACCFTQHLKQEPYKSQSIWMPRKCQGEGCYAFARPVMSEAKVTNVNKNDYVSLCTRHETIPRDSFLLESCGEHDRYFGHYTRPEEWAVDFYNKYMTGGRLAVVYIHQNMLDLCSTFLHSFADRRFDFQLREYETKYQFWPGYSYQGVPDVSALEISICHVCAFLERLREIFETRGTKRFLQIEEIAIR